MNQALNKLPSLSNAVKIFEIEKKYTSYIFLDRDFYLKSNTAHSAIANSRKKERKCIIISPSLYWIRKKEINGVLSGGKTKKIAEIVFEDIDNISDYEKVAVKGEGNLYYFVAVDSKQVLKNIQNLLGVDGSELDYAIAQDAFLGNQTQIELNENYSLATIDGIIEKIPSAYLESQKKIDFQSAAKLIRKKFSIFSLKQKKRDKLDRDEPEEHLGRWAKLSAAATVVLGLALLTNGIINVKRASEISKKADELREGFKLPQTSMEIDNIISKAKNIESSQAQLRNTVGTVNAISLQPGESIESIKLSASQGVITIKSTRDKELENTLKKDINITKTDSNSGLITFKTVFK